MAAASPDKPKDDIERLTIPMSGGKPRWDRMRPETQSKLRAILSTGETTASASSSTPASFHPVVVHALYDMLGQLIVIAAKARGASEPALAVLAFTADEKARLTEPTQRVLAKYAGSLLRYEDELALAFTLLAIAQAKIAAFHHAATVAPIVPLTSSPAYAPTVTVDDSVIVS
ncbi:MAG TPA: hypothetical protein VJ842_14375 [Pyrinomonadaceae bacterium]|nr:hypothetical protein [Pyrinomonadaceae bacterium]